MLTPEITTKVARTYADLTSDNGPPTFDLEFGSFLLALDLNGQGRFASWVWRMVSLARDARGEGYAHGWLDRFAGPVLGMNSHGMS